MNEDANEGILKTIKKKISEAIDSHEKTVNQTLVTQDKRTEDALNIYATEVGEAIDTHAKAVEKTLATQNAGIAETFETYTKSVTRTYRNTMIKIAAIWIAVGALNIGSNVYLRHLKDHRTAEAKQEIVSYKPKEIIEGTEFTFQQKPIAHIEGKWGAHGLVGAVDWDHDKDMDLLVANKDGSVNVYENIDGKFCIMQSVAKIPSTGHYYNGSSFAAADWDNDGKNDLLTMNKSGYVYWYKNMAKDTLEQKL
ncbi:VCBS repeat-containing protein [Candidatus Woesearchaeota archaeon]|nr:MAG: VCBS repeat-containing protein [Candidatus Woesearchaeota archaeon]